MSERKAINKYYPPDWDPSQTVKRKKTGNPDIKIRMMAPYSMRCTKCNEYIAQRRSFNARKEITNEKYLSTKIIRFHISCPRCNNKITFKTNPQTAGYTPEEGGVRNYEPTKKAIAPESEDELLKRLEKEEKDNLAYQETLERRKKNPFWQKIESLKDGTGDVLENLEKRLEQQQRQQAISDHLEELQHKSTQLQVKGGTDELTNEATKKVQAQIIKLQQIQTQLQEREDEEAAKKAFQEPVEPSRKRALDTQSERVTVSSTITIKKPKKTAASTGISALAAYASSSESESESE